MGVVIVDYDVGNLRSVQKAFERVGAPAQVSRDPAVIAGADAVVLPGVGAFAECMGNLARFGLTETVRATIGSGRPFLGICVGYQLLFESSEEFGDTPGLGILPGRCALFRPDDHAMKVPHMGWNQLAFPRTGRLFAGVAEGADVYFVHSYYPVPADDGVVTATCDYGVTFAASAERGNLFGTQFHPEKSQRVGLTIVENFVRIAAAAP